MAKQKQPVQFGAPPRVDLLPEAQREDLRLERLLPRMGLIVVASAVVAALIWFAGLLPVDAANQRLAAAESDSADLITEIAGFSDLQKTLNKESGLAGYRQTLTAGEVMFGERMTEIRKLMPSDLTATNYQGQLISDDPEAATDQAFNDLDPLCVAETALLTVTFHGPDLVLDQAARVVAKMTDKTVAGFQCVVGTKVVVEQTGDPQEVIVQIALGEAALAGRFAEEES